MYNGVRFGIIAAMDASRGLGCDNKLLVTNKEEMAHFKQTTDGCVVIMGYNTFMSIGGKGLEGRINIVITSKENVDRGMAIVLAVSSIEDAFKLAGLFTIHRKNSKSIRNREVFVIGGAQLYEKLINYADKIILSTYDKSYPEADVFFPEIPNTFYRQLVRHTGFNFKIEEYYKRTKDPGFFRKCAEHIRELF